MATRECASCGHEKPVSGVWYVIAERSGSFMCGSCFHEETGQPVAGLQV